MIYSRLRKSIGVLVLAVLFMPLIAKAAVPEWQIVPSESNITFTGTQNNAPISGQFKKFSGSIAFDPNQLNESKIKIVIDTNSVSTSYADFTSTLLTPDWFDVKLFPEATFQASQFTKTGQNTFEANGNLTIRDKTLPVKVVFTGEELSKTKASVKGSTSIKRTAFGVGAGEWASTDEVQDDVKINFTITAIKK